MHICELVSPRHRSLLKFQALTARDWLRTSSFPHLLRRLTSWRCQCRRMTVLAFPASSRLSSEHGLKLCLLKVSCACACAYPSPKTENRSTVKLHSSHHVIHVLPLTSSFSNRPQRLSGG